MIKNNFGMGMASVIAAVCVFAAGVVLFYKSVDMAVDMYERALEEDNKTEEMREDFYFNKDENQSGRETEIEFKDTKSLDKIKIKCETGEYNGDGFKVYFFK